jgi:hypothetical protein
MAIIIKHTYCTHVSVVFYDDEAGISLRYDDCGSMDDIAERACEVLVKHNFAYADVCSAETSEVLMTIERT